MSEKSVIFVLSGPSGGGKGTVLKEFRKKVEIDFSVSATTRAPREGEVDGKDYHFVKREDFQELIDKGEMLEYTEFCGNFYGTPKSEADRALEKGRDIIFEIESNGAFNIKKLYPDAVLVMLMPKTLSELEERLRDRGSETEETLKRRLSTAVKEISLAEKYDYVVVNETGKIEECAEALAAILKAERQKSARMTNEINNFLNITEETDK